MTSHGSYLSYFQKSGSRFYKQNFKVEFYSLLEMTNQKSHKTILTTLIGWFQRRVKLHDEIFVYRIGSRFPSNKNGLKPQVDGNSIRSPSEAFPVRSPKMISAQLGINRANKKEISEFFSTPRKQKQKQTNFISWLIGCRWRHRSTCRYLRHHQRKKFDLKKNKTKSSQKCWYLRIVSTFNWLSDLKIGEPDYIW